MNAVTEAIRNRLPKLMANASIAQVFFAMSFIVLWTLSGISTEIVFLLQIGLLIVAGIFLVHTLLDASMIINKATGLFLRRLGIKDGWSRQRTFKDTIYLVTIF